MKAQGFTLIEILIALVILSLVSIAAFSSLNHMIKVKTKQKQHQDFQMKITQAYAELMQDMASAVPVPLADQGNVVIALTPIALSLTRTLAGSMTQSDSTPVRYEWGTGDLLRIMGDRSQIMLNGVKDVTVEIMNGQKHWMVVSGSMQEMKYPAAIRFTFKQETMGEVLWAFELPH